MRNLISWGILFLFHMYIYVLTFRENWEKSNWAKEKKILYIHCIWNFLEIVWIILNMIGTLNEPSIFNTPYFIMLYIHGLIFFYSFRDKYRTEWLLFIITGNLLASVFIGLDYKTNLMAYGVSTSLNVIGFILLIYINSYREKKSLILYVIKKRFLIFNLIFLLLIMAIHLHYIKLIDLEVYRIISTFVVMVYSWCFKNIKINNNVAGMIRGVSKLMFRISLVGVIVQGLLFLLGVFY